MPGKLRKLAIEHGAKVPELPSNAGNCGTCGHPAGGVHSHGTEAADRAHVGASPRGPEPPKPFKITGGK